MVSRSGQPFFAGLEAKHAYTLQWDAPFPKKSTPSHKVICSDQPFQSNNLIKEIRKKNIN